MNTHEKGLRAEQVAAGYLKARGYTIWKTNWRWGRKELDLVALHRNELIIVEVKASVESDINDPSEVVGPGKQRNIVLAAEAFIRLHDCHYATRFDVISVLYERENVEIEHYENAFYPMAE